MVPKIPVDALLPPYMSPDDLSTLDWAYAGLITHKGTWTFQSSGDTVDAAITAVDYDKQLIHIALYQNGAQWYQIAPPLVIFMAAFTFDAVGDACREEQFAQYFKIDPSTYKLWQGSVGALLKPVHVCGDNRKTYDSGWSRYDYCSICDKKIT